MALESRSRRPARTSKGRPAKKRIAKVAAGRVRKRAAVTAGSRMVEVALAAFAHEVRTPLTGILAISDLHSAPTGLLRMTAAVAYGERFIVPLVNEFMARHPQLRVDIELSNRTLDLVQEGYDLAIRLGKLGESRLVATRIAPRAMYLCAAPGYLERYGRPHTLSELARHNCLIGTSDVWSFQSDGREQHFKPSGNWRCNSGQAVLDAALRGFGLCQLPDYYVLEPLRRGELVSLLEANQPPDTAVWAVYPQRRYPLPKVRLLVEALKVGLAARPEYRGGQS